MKHFLLFTIFVAVPVTAQFGVPGNRRQAGTNFQDLQELAKKKASDAAEGGVGLDDLMKQLKDDPEYMKQLEDSMSQFGGAMEEMMKMSPEELAQQMEEAMKLFTDGDIVENVLNQKDEVLKSLEASGIVTEDELEKFKADPNYFEQKMRESFSQMGDLFNNPEYVGKATEIMQGLSEMVNNPDSIKDFADMMGSQFDSDEEIEELRLQLMSEDFSELIPTYSELFGSDDIQDVLKDPTKFRDMIKNPPFDQAKMEL